MRRERAHPGRLRPLPRPSCPSCPSCALPRALPPPRPSSLRVARLSRRQPPMRPTPQCAHAAPAPAERHARPASSSAPPPPSLRPLPFPAPQPPRARCTACLASSHTRQGRARTRWPSAGRQHAPSHSPSPLHGAPADWRPRACRISRPRQMACRSRKTPRTSRRSGGRPSSSSCPRALALARALSVQIHALHGRLCQIFSRKPSRRSARRLRSLSRQKRRSRPTSRSHRRPGHRHCFRQLCRHRGLEHRAG
mmetsp:Transcript_18781/g.61417  ORF Transcript_18781/g.61417 Transcript_18781/m.61417 type:complete len:252 (+) Transcript_18781:653-1408(+)|eukprot:scaffold14362_cov142-Isochrysis_galbana.AAC.10